MTTPDPATFTGLLEVCHANGLDIKPWVKLSSGLWVIPNYCSGPCQQYQADTALPMHLAAVCFEVAKWLVHNGCRIRPVFGATDNVSVEIWTDGKFVRDVFGPTMETALAAACAYAGERC